MTLKDRSLSHYSDEKTDGGKVLTNLFNITRLKSGSGI